MPKITFLAATAPAVALTKTITMRDGETSSEPYPRVARFTSETVDIPTIVEFCKELNTRIKSGQCLLKGTIARPLTDESRAGSTTTDTITQWVCFDLDKAPFKTHAEFMTAIKMGDVSYVVQYSSSFGLPDTIGLSCHIFAFLSAPIGAPQLKSWLQYLNMNVKPLREGLRPSSMAVALSYPLDITCCQNDKLIYTNHPVFKGMANPVKDSDRVAFIKGKRDVIDITHIALHAPAALNKMARDILNEKRVLMQLPKLTAKTVIVGEYLIQNNPGEMTITGGPREERDFVYFNVNNGKNWSYYHPVGNYELIHNFKSEPCVRTKDVFPDYYKECVRQRNDLQQSPTTGGDEILAFRDCNTSSYWHGTFNEANRQLTLHPARSETQVEHFMMSHGRQPLSFIPLHQRIFDPTSDIIIDKDALPYPTVNMFHPSEYMKSAKKLKQPSLGGCPTIARIIEHVVGKGPILDHFYNWLAVMFQLRVKPLTAWVLHGVQGTGKDTLVDRILAPLFGKQWTVTRNQTELNSDFTGWIEYAILAHIREIEIDSLENGGAVESKLKNYIVDITVPIRRMRTDSYEAKNFTGMIFSSNKNQPVKIAVDDRRYNVGIFQHLKLEVTIHELEVTIDKELQSFADYLMSRVADRKTAATPLRTQERDDIMALSMTSADHTAQYIKDGNLEGMWEAMPDEKTINEVYGATSLATFANAYASLMRRCLTDYLERRESKLTRDEMGTIFMYCVGNVPTSPNKLTQYLAHHGLKTERLRNGVERVYGVKIEWFASDAFIKDVTQNLPEPVKLKSVSTRRKVV